MARKTADDAAKAAEVAETHERAELDRQREARLVRHIDADTEARRAQATGGMVRAAAVTGSAGLAGFAIGGPIGGAVGVGIGWLVDHFIDSSRRR